MYSASVVHLTIPFIAYFNHRYCVCRLCTYMYVYTSIICLFTYIICSCCKQCKTLYTLIMQSLFSVPVPAEWDMQNNVVVVQPVSTGSKEHDRVLTHIHQTLPEAQLFQVERIQNLWLWEKYYHCCDRMRLKCAESAQEKDLFHGTSITPPVEVYQSEHGFDFRLAHMSRCWGTGSYFTPSAKYADKYAHKVPGSTHKQLLLAKVLTGQTCLWPQEPTLRRPPP